MQDDFLAKLQALKDQYVSALPQTLQQLEQQFQALMAADLSSHDSHEFYRLTHSLTGSGATYGFSDLSQAARTLELTLKEFNDAEPENREALVAMVEQQYHELTRQVIDASQSQSDNTSVNEIDIEIDPWTILIADDEVFSLERLALMLESEGHTVVRAQNGQQAIDLYEAHLPDLVIMDVVMPVMDGQESARIIKQKSAGQFVPIIFLTSLEQESDLVRCIQSGGDDFLVKPFSRAVLHARIFAMQRIKKLQVELERYQSQTEEEITMARSVFYSATNRNCKGHHELEAWTESCGHFSGDVLCYAPAPDNSLYIMLGDFTGHGLRAAIGAIPAADIFYEHANRNGSIEGIVKAINQKLKELLPIGQFMCGAFVKVDNGCRQLSIINAGLPALFRKSSAGQSELVASSNLPLGIMSSDQYSVEMYNADIGQDEFLFAYSDGIIEAHNPQGEMYGEQRLHDVLTSTADLQAAISVLQSDLETFLEQGEPGDDVTLVGVRLDSDS